MLAWNVLGNNKKGHRMARHSQKVIGHENARHHILRIHLVNIFINLEQ